MIAILLLIVVVTIAFGILVAIVGRGKYRWVALSSGAFAFWMLVALVVLLLGSGTVAIGTSGSVAQVLIVGCVASLAIACAICVIYGSIAIRARNRKVGV